MKIFLYVVALILIAFGAAISVMSWLAPGDVLVGVTPALGASLLVGGLVLLGLGVIVAGLQELNANILHLLYLVSEQQNAFAGTAGAVTDMEEAASYEEPPAPAVSPAATTMPVTDEAPAVAQAPVAADAPSPGHMAAAAAVAAMAAQGSAGETAAREQSAGSVEKPVVEDIPVVPGTGELRTQETVPPAAAGQPGAATKASQANKSPAKPAAGEGKGSEAIAKKPAAASSGGAKAAAEFTSAKKAGRTEPEAGRPQAQKKGGQSSAEKRAEKPAAAPADGEKGGKAMAAAGQAGKPAGSPAESVKKEPATSPAEERKKPAAPVAEKKEPDKAGEEVTSAAEARSGDADTQSAVERLTGAATSTVRDVAGKGQSAAEKIAARLEALKKESVFADKKTAAATGAAAASEDDGEAPLGKALKDVVEPAGETAGMEAGGELAGEDLLYVVEQRVIRGRSARILSDGTIEAEMDEGWLRFENREHLDEYLDALEAEK